jgi:hypothetical protein
LQADSPRVEYDVQKELDEQNKQNKGGSQGAARSAERLHLQHTSVDAELLLFAE